MKSKVHLLAFLTVLMSPCVVGQVYLDTVFTPPGYDQGPITATVSIPNVPNGVGVVLAAGTGMSRSHLSVWSNALAANGYTTMAIDYFDLNSSFCYYGYAVRTFKLAVQFLRRNAARFKITTGKIVGLGQSEGSTHWGESIVWDNDYVYFRTDQNISDHLDAAVLLYGVYDWMSDDMNITAMRYFSKNSSLRGTKGNCMANVANITTPLLLFHGTADFTVPVQHSLGLRDTLIALKKSCQLVTGPWNHGFDQASASTFTSAGLQAKDLTLTFLKNSVLTSAVTSEPVSVVPSKFSLAQNYPNPFNPGTTISYEIPQASNVSIKIINTLGQTVATLIDEHKEPGFYQVRWNANVPSGIYFYRLQAGDASTGSARGFVETKKMILLR
jgi:dienelactone hydrolase